MNRILAIGGGGFLMEDLPSPIDAFLIQLVGKPRPRVCYIGTPNGDMPDGIAKFYAAFSDEFCERSHLAFFRKPAPGSASLEGFRAHVLSQDVVFVAGGNTKSALGVWREWGLDEVFREAYVNGILLAGMSAGALCWFEAGLTDSFAGGDYRPLSCLGLLPGACGVHYQSDAIRKQALFAAIESGSLPEAIAIDDQAAALYENGLLARVLSWRPGATAYSVSLRSGRAYEQALQYSSIGRVDA